MVKKALGKLVRYFIPLRYYSCYGDMEGNKLVSTWKMWKGKVYNHRCFKVAEEISAKGN